MSEYAHVRVKPHLTIGTLGHAGHGKTTLTSAIGHVLARVPGCPLGVPPQAPPCAAQTASPSAMPPATPFAPPPRTPAAVPGVPAAPPSPPDGVGVRHTYETDTRRYTHLDLPGRAERAGAVIAGAAQLDGAVLVVSALDGVRAQTAEHVLLARQMGVEHLVVALSMAEECGDELTELVELDVRALLTAHGYAGDTLPMVRVSGTRALAGDPRWTGAIEALLDAVDTYVPLPERDVRAPFLLPVESARTLAGPETELVGTVERGTVRLGDRVILHAPRGGADSHVAGIEISGRPVPGARAGDGVALRLGAVHGNPRGGVLAAPHGLAAGRGLTAELRLLTAAQGGRAAPARSGYRARFHFRTAEVGGVTTFSPERAVFPGTTVSARVLLDAAVPLEEGLRFAVREGGGTVALGTVTRCGPGEGEERAEGEEERGGDGGQGATGTR
ncbi:GTP-binding protein [Streptomyces iconiensis]|uniref:GTP-binding protein n=1 Tax=Streptomyces iconiensis TaxID=1384038 RepID=A0ABT7A2S5_9ACTN|nr:GTP-binding protein [Streptomyces iconiensis]MDJ1135622.1 GTP-binding protein [Streptomyces iconiensis]